jgi:TANK-binding kinase 1
LLNKENDDVALASEGDIPKFPDFKSVNTYASSAKTFCSVGHACKRQVEKLSQSSLLIQACVKQFTAMVTKDLTSVEAKRSKLNVKLELVEERQTDMKRAHETIRNLMNSLPEGDIGSVDDSTVTRNQPVKHLGKRIHKLYERVVTESDLWNTWCKATSMLPCPVKSRASGFAHKMVGDLHDSWQDLLRYKTTEYLTKTEEQYHQSVRIMVRETGQSLRTLLDMDCQSAVAEWAAALAKWYKEAKTVYFDMHKLDKDLDEYEERLNSFSQQ